MSPPGPNNLLSAPQFIRIRDLCMSLYANAGEKDRLGKDRLGIALANALRGLGLPCPGCFSRARSSLAIGRRSGVAAGHSVSTDPRASSIFVPARYGRSGAGTSVWS